uniref:Metalloendopeptidase n=1 Tax=Plectus sambesii TaxID=2011161 RepID=A0A914XDK1_9BILA
MARFFGLLLCCLVALIADAKRGKRVNIYKQARGDINQLKPISNSAVLNALRRDSTKKWDYLKDTSGNNVVPYVIQGQYESDEISILMGALKRIEENACIRFRPRTTEADYIEFQNGYYEGCYTTVGRSPGKNVVMLEANDLATCMEHDIVIHEVLHSLGLWHEQMRYDRDTFIKVNWDNIPLNLWPQFEKVTEAESTTYDIGYEYRSIMHYPKDAFAKIPGLITMQTLDPAAEDIIGTQKEASPSDFKKLCNVYECRMCMGKAFANQTATTPTTTTTKKPTKTTKTTKPTKTTKTTTTTTTTTTRRPRTTKTTTTTTTTTTRPTPRTRPTPAPQTKTTRRPRTTKTTTTTTTTTTRPTPRTRPTPAPQTPAAPQPKVCLDHYGMFCQQLLGVNRDACDTWSTFMLNNCCLSCRRQANQNKIDNIRKPKSHWDLQPNNFAFDGWF